jgi:hypothetical protein
MMTVRCYLAPSSIEGLGVFAAEPVKKGDVVWQFDPLLDQMIPEEVLAAQPPHVREFLDRYGYPHHELPGILVLDADEGRFMNHADTPNLDFSTPDIGIATRDLSPGEEFTCNYADFTIGEVVHQPPRHRVHNGSAAARHPLVMQEPH